MIAPDRQDADEPLDPKSPEGIAVAERLTRTLARIQVAIAERERAAAQAGRAA